MKINTNLYFYSNDYIKIVSFIKSSASSDPISTNKVSFSGVFSLGEFEKNFIVYSFGCCKFLSRYTRNV